jgi:ABC-type transporter Mla maintaining outer membrane lipid asymmetry ATPase subunit MlaF
MAPQGTQPNTSGNFEELVAWVHKKLTLLDVSVTWDEKANIAVVDFLTGTGAKTLSVTSDSENDNKISLICDPQGKKSYQ